MPQVIVALFGAIRDNLEALYLHFSKQNQPLVTQVILNLQDAVRTLQYKVQEHCEVDAYKYRELQLKHTRELQYSELLKRFQSVCSAEAVLADELKMMKNNNIIGAIKLYRQRTEVSLKAAKDFVEGYMQKNKLGRYGATSNEQ